MVNYPAKTDFRPGEHRQESVSYVQPSSSETDAVIDEKT